MPDLPHGKVTLVFTDVESSTALVQRLGDGYAQVLNEHRSLLRDVVTASDGHVVDQTVAPPGPESLLAAGTRR